MTKRYLRCRSGIVNLNDSMNYSAYSHGRCGASIPTHTDDMIWDGRTFPKRLGAITMIGNVSIRDLTLTKDVDKELRDGMIESAMKHKPTQKKQ